MSRFFIDRPVFAWVLSIVIVLCGAVCFLALPIAQYPPIVPPTIQVTATYPGASAKTVADTVGQPIEEQVNGVEGMIYMSSTCTNNGNYTLTVSFDVGTDIHTALMMVQIRVQLAMPQLPEIVQKQGVNVQMQSPNILLAVNLISPDGRLRFAVPEQLRPDQHLRRALAAAWGWPGDVPRPAAVQHARLARSAEAGVAGHDGQRSHERHPRAERRRGRRQHRSAAGAQGAKLSARPEHPGPADHRGAVRRHHRQGRPGRPLRPPPGRGPPRARRPELGPRSARSAPCRTASWCAIPPWPWPFSPCPRPTPSPPATPSRRRWTELKKQFPQGLDYQIAYDTTPFIRHSVRGRHQHDLYRRAAW